MKDVKILLGNGTIHVPASRLFYLLSGTPSNILTEDARLARKTILDGLQDHMARWGNSDAPSPTKHSDPLPGGIQGPSPPCELPQYGGLGSKGCDHPDSIAGQAEKKATEALKLAFKAHDRLDELDLRVGKRLEETWQATIALVQRYDVHRDLKKLQERFDAALHDLDHHRERICNHGERTTRLEARVDHLAPRFEKFMVMIADSLNEPKPAKVKKTKRK